MSIAKRNVKQEDKEIPDARAYYESHLKERGWNGRLDGNTPEELYESYIIAWKERDLEDVRTHYTSQLKTIGGNGRLKGRTREELDSNFYRTFYETLLRKSGLSERLSGNTQEEVFREYTDVFRQHYTYVLKRYGWFGKLSGNTPEELYDRFKPIFNAFRKKEFDRHVEMMRVTDEINERNRVRYESMKPEKKVSTSITNISVSPVFNSLGNRRFRINIQGDNTQCSVIINEGYDNGNFTPSITIQGDPTLAEKYAGIDGHKVFVRAAQEKFLGR